MSHSSTFEIRVDKTYNLVLMLFLNLVEDIQTRETYYTRSGGVC